MNIVNLIILLVILILPMVFTFWAIRDVVYGQFPTMQTKYIWLAVVDTELGKFVYKNLSEQPGILVLEGKVSELKKAIDELEEQLRQKEKELGRIREEDGIDFDS